MCGIAGFVDGSDSLPDQALAEASQAVAHRGPDDSGLKLFSSGGVRIGLATRRLAILDLSPAGHQPMHDPTRENWIVFNGEIYNFREVRTRLAKLGIKFNGNSDTEVVLKAYGHFGESCLNELRGMFAFAIWDATRQKLFLARDRLGIKPLYYWQKPGCLFFASEVRALLATGVIPRHVNPQGMVEFLMFGSVYDPDTLIEGVQALPPSCSMIWHSGTVQQRRFWDIPAVSPPVDFRSVEEDISTKLPNKLEEAFALHLVSDVPVGVFLSGGIDSGALVAVLSSADTAELATFSVVFKEAEHSEADFSRAIAKRFRTDHHEITLSAGEFLKSIPDAFRAMDQPTVDGLNTFVISREVRKAGLKVALSGLGGDELFAGYDSFRSVPKMERLLKHAPAVARKALAKALQITTRADDRQNKLLAFLQLSGPAIHPYFLTRALFLPTQQNVLFTAPRRAEQNRLEESLAISLARTSNMDAVNRVSCLELQNYTANTLLRDVDCMSMACGLEVRLPFLDHKLVEYVLALPGAMKVRKNTPKYLLIQSLCPQLPREIVYRPKQGFTFPFSHWLRHELFSEMENTFKSWGNSCLAEIISGLEVNAVWRRFLEGKHSWSRPWSLYVINKWATKNLA